MQKKFVFPLILVGVVGCTSVQKAEFDPESWNRAPSSEQSAYSRFVDYLGVKAYYANLHSHHYIEHRGDALPETGLCPKFKSFPQDDGRPCRANADGQPEVVPLAKNAEGKTDQLDYFRMYCDYAKENGGVDILLVSLHSKTGKDQDADTRPQSFVERHKILPEINKKYGGKFLCAIGQEASSISKGNHVNIMGHMRQKNTDVTKPFYFDAGAFDVFYKELAERRAAGEQIILQFNHPDVLDDNYFGTLNLEKATEGMEPKQAKKVKEKFKEMLNDYGVDDYEPVRSLLCQTPRSANAAHCQGVTPARDSVTMAMIKESYKKIVDQVGGAYKLIEVTQTDLQPKGKPSYGATSNASEQFWPVQMRAAEMAEGRQRKGPDSGLLAYIFYLKMGFKISPTANQDNHHMNPGSALASRTGVLAKSLSEDDVYNALANRLTFASEDKNAKLVVAARNSDNKTVLMGQDLKVSGDKAVVYIAYEDGDEAEPVDVRVYSYHESDELSFDRKNPLGAVRTIQFKADGPALPEGEAEPVDLKEGVANGAVKGLKLPVRKGRTILFVELTQKDQDKIWSAPLFVEAD